MVISHLHHLLGAFHGFQGSTHTFILLSSQQIRGCAQLHTLVMGHGEDVKSDQTAKPTCQGDLEISLILLFLVHFAGLTLGVDAEPGADVWPAEALHPHHL